MSTSGSSFVIIFKGYYLIIMINFNFTITENEAPLLAGHLKLMKTLFTCEGVDKRRLGNKIMFVLFSWQN